MRLAEAASPKFPAFASLPASVLPWEGAGRVPGAWKPQIRTASQLLVLLEPDGVRTGQQQRGALWRGVWRLQIQPVTAGEKTWEIKGHRPHRGTRSPAGDLPERSGAPWSHRNPPGAAAGSLSPTSAWGQQGHGSRSPGCCASLVPPVCLQVPPGGV